MSSLRVNRFGPSRTWAAPGAIVDAELDVRVRERTAVELHVDLLDGPRPVATQSAVVEVAAPGNVIQVPIRLPSRRRRGYGLRLRVRAVGGGRGRVHEASVEALDGWWESPRHVALTEFASRARSRRHLRRATEWNVTVAQAYDWMYRHYDYLPPADPFVDALGRKVSHAALTAGIEAGRAAGVATLAYGSVYGPEPEYVHDHPDEVLRDETGAPLSLGGMFFITDLRPGSPWRARLLDEYERACRVLGFDGVHMDTYGPPHDGWTADGAHLRFADVYPGLIEEAARRLATLPGTPRVLFNCVEGFPLEAVAPAPAAALYLELWPPDDRWSDIVSWIERSKALAGDRQVVIAAYAAALKGLAADDTGRTGAVESAAILGSVVMATGAYHHVLADGDRLLVEGYYPAAAGLRPAEAAELRAAWRFHARHVHLVSDPRTRPVDATGIEVLDEVGNPVPVADRPRAGAVWLRATQTPDGPVIQLVDLIDQAHDRWTEPAAPSRRRAGWSLRWDARGPVGASPWTARGAAASLRPVRGAASARWRLPSFRRWLVIWDPQPER